MSSDTRKPIAIFGAGGFGREVALLVRRITQANMWGKYDYDFIGFFDDRVATGTDRVYGKVLGNIDTLNAWPSPLAVVIAIGDPSSLRKVAENITNPNVSFPNIFDLSTAFADINSNSIGHGNIFMGRNSFSCGVAVGNFNIFNDDISVGHDAIIGDYNVIMPSVHISGSVTIGTDNLIGVNSCIIQELKIGHHVRLGAGSVLMTKPRDNSTYIGVPAKIYKF